MELITGIFMAIRHEFSSVEYQSFRSEVRDSLFNWHDAQSTCGDKLVIDESDIESLVSDLADTIMINRLDAQSMVEDERGITSPQGLIRRLIQCGRRVGSRLLPDWLLPRDQCDWRAIWTGGLFIWHTSLVVMTLALKGSL